MNEAASIEGTSKLTCYGLHWARMTLDVPTEQIKSRKPAWLVWFGEQAIMDRHNVRMKLKKVEVEDR